MGCLSSCIISDSLDDIGNQYNERVYNADLQYVKSIIKAEKERHHAISVVGSNARTGRLASMRDLELDTIPVQLNANMVQIMSRMLVDVDESTRRCIMSRYNGYEL